MRRRDPRQTNMLDMFRPPPEPPPPGFEPGSLPDTITPISGQNAGVPMLQNSALAQCLRQEQKR